MAEYASEEGATSFTVMDTANVVVAAVVTLFNAVTVYDAVTVTVVGVPVMSPVVLSRASPAGSDGLTEYEFAALALGVTLDDAVVIAVPLVSVIGEALYVNAIWFTVREMDFVVEPPLFVAVMVTLADAYVAVGVPVIAPVPALIARPAGSVPLVTA